MVTVSSRKGMINNVTPATKDLLIEALMSAKKTRKTVRAKIHAGNLNHMPSYMSHAIDRLNAKVARG